MASVQDIDQFVKELTGEKNRNRDQVLFRCIAGFLLVAFAWAALTEIDEVTRGEGKIIPSRQLQEVQSLEGGLIKEILVRKGQEVEKDDVLLVLDSTSSAGSFEQMRQRELALKAEIARLNAEIRGHAAGAGDVAFELPADITQEAPDVAASQRDLFASRRAQRASELNVIEQQVLQKEKELKETQSDQRAASEAVTLSSREIELIKPLVARGIESEVALLQLQRSHADLKGRLDAATQRAERLRAAKREIEEKRASMLDNYRSEALKSLSEATAELAEVEKSMPGFRDKMTRAEIRSPVRGVVNRVLTTTVGGVARAGEPLVEIVPLDDTLLVEAKIKPADIAFLHPGQKVKVKITAYDFARYGAMDGELSTIAADAVEDVHDKKPYYPVMVEVQSALEDAKGRPLDIVPGMVAQIDVLTGRRSVLDYLVQPVVKMKDTAFREN